MIKNIENIKTLYDFWNNAVSVVVYFIDKNGKEINDMDYPTDTEVLNIRHIELDQYEVMLNV